MRTELLNAAEQMALCIRTFQVGTLQFPSTSFPIHYLLIALTSGPVQSELLAISLSGPKIRTVQECVLLHAVI